MGNLGAGTYKLGSTSHWVKVRPQKETTEQFHFLLKKQNAEIIPKQLVATGMLSNYIVSSGTRPRNSRKPLTSHCVNRFTGKSHAARGGTPAHGTTRTGAPAPVPLNPATLSLRSPRPPAALPASRCFWRF